MDSASPALTRHLWAGYFLDGNQWPGRTVFPDGINMPVSNVSLQVRE